MKNMMDQTIENKKGLARELKNEFNFKYLYSMVLENRFIKYLL